MLEHTLTRHNDLVDPLLRVWGWEIPVYLFLGGLVAGMMIVTGLLQIRRPGHLSWSLRSLPVVGLTLLTLGMLALFLDLEHKAQVWRLYTTFEPTSVMSWGAWILLLVYPVLLASLFVRPIDTIAALVPPALRMGSWFDRHPQVVHAIAAANLGFGVGLGIYTGILLSTLSARPLWNTGLLGPLFLLSGLSSAAAFVHVFTDDVEERTWTERADTAFLGLELVALLLLVLGLATSSRASQEAGALFLGGPYTAVFWVLVVGLGVVVPLVIQLLVVIRRVRHSPVAPVLVLTGGLVLRFVFVYAGQVSHY